MSIQRGKYRHTHPEKPCTARLSTVKATSPKHTLSSAEVPVLSNVEVPVLSSVEVPVLSDVEVADRTTKLNTGMGQSFSGEIHRMFLLTMWQEDETAWRFQLEDPRSGQRMGFAEIESLVDGLHDVIDKQSD